jgi:hypothetical protein
MPGEEGSTLDLVDRQIAESRRRIAAQQERLEELQNNGHSHAAAAAEMMLETMAETHAALEAYRQTLVRINARERDF